MLSSSVKSYRPSKGTMSARYQGFGRSLKKKRYRSKLFRRSAKAAVVAQAAMRGEVKFHDVDLNDAVISAVGSITDSIVKIASGTGESQRDGRLCTVASVGWRYRLTLPEYVNAATPSPGDVARLIMYLDRQANGATAAVTDILESADYQSFNNLSNKSRFLTLCDKKIVMNYDTLSGVTGAVDGAVKVYEGNVYKKLNIPLEFSSTAGAITELRSNNIGVLLISAFGVATFNSKIRVRFVG